MGRDLKESVLAVLYCIENDLYEKRFNWQEQLKMGITVNSQILRTPCATTNKWAQASFLMVSYLVSWAKNKTNCCRPDHTWYLSSSNHSLEVMSPIKSILSASSFKRCLQNVVNLLCFLCAIATIPKFLCHHSRDTQPESKSVDFSKATAIIATISSSATSRHGSSASYRSWNLKQGFGIKNIICYKLIQFTPKWMWIDLLFASFSFPMDEIYGSKSSDKKSFQCFLNSISMPVFKDLNTLWVLLFEFNNPTDL